MLKWEFERMDWTEYRFKLMDEFGTDQLVWDKLPSPLAPILEEILQDTLFARKIHGGTEIFNNDSLSKEDQMDAKITAIWKLEDED